MKVTETNQKDTFPPCIASKLNLLKAGKLTAETVNLIGVGEKKLSIDTS